VGAQLCSADVRPGRRMCAHSATPTRVAGLGSPAALLHSVLPASAGAAHVEVKEHILQGVKFCLVIPQAHIGVPPVGGVGWVGGQGGGLWC
jgi:hypothetical protein